MKYHTPYAFTVCTDTTIPLFYLLYSSTITRPVIQLLDKNLLMTSSTSLITKYTDRQTDRLTRQSQNNLGAFITSKRDGIDTYQKIGRECHIRVVDCQ
jgi:hypothetical protein